MARDLDLLFDYECKRRPHLAMLRDTLATMSVAEIEQVKLPLKWMRQVLLARKRQQMAKGEQARLLATLGDHIVDGVRPDPLGEMRRWTGPSTFLRVARGSSIQVHPDSLVWLPFSGGVWIETVFSPRVDPVLARASTALGMARKSAYMTAYREMANRLIGPDTPVLLTQTNALAAYGVRFS